MACERARNRAVEVGTEGDTQTHHTPHRTTHMPARSLAGQHARTDTSGHERAPVPEPVVGEVDAGQGGAVPLEHPPQRPRLRRRQPLRRAQRHVFVGVRRRQPLRRAGRRRGAPKDGERTL